MQTRQLLRCGKSYKQHKTRRYKPRQLRNAQVRHFQVLHFQALWLGPSFSGLAFSGPVNWSVIFQVLHFQSPHTMHIELAHTEYTLRTIYSMYSVQVLVCVGPVHISTVLYKTILLIKTEHGYVLQWYGNYYYCYCCYYYDDFCWTSHFFPTYSKHFNCILWAF